MGSYALSFVAKRLKHSHDKFELKDQLRRMGLVTLPIGNIGIAGDILNEFFPFPEPLFATHHLLRFFFLHTIIAMLMTYPVWRSFRQPVSDKLNISTANSAGTVSTDASRDEDPGHEERDLFGLYASYDINKATIEARSLHVPDSVFRPKTLKLSLRQILHTPKYKGQLASLKKHLAGEFSVESLLFYFEAHKYQRLVSKLVNTQGQEDTVPTPKRDEPSACSGRALPAVEEEGTGNNESKQPEVDKAGEAATSESEVPVKENEDVIVDLQEQKDVSQDSSDRDKTSEKEDSRSTSSILANVAAQRIVNVREKLTRRAVRIYKEYVADGSTTQVRSV